MYVSRHFSVATGKAQHAYDATHTIIATGIVSEDFAFTIKR
jgi:hypothetical protein